MNRETMIRDFIINELQFEGRPDELTGDYPLLEKEVIDSIGIFRIVGFIEDRFGVEVDDEDLVPDNFASIDAITAYVESARSPS